MLGLVLPLHCGGCGAPDTRWCDACATALSVGDDEPRLIATRHDPGAPVFALGRHAGARRQAIVGLKEHGRADLIAPLSVALASGIHRLLLWGVLEAPVAVVPAPTRRLAARRRGGDPVTRVAGRAIAQCPSAALVSALRLKALVRDSVGLSSSDRERNIAGRVILTRTPPHDCDVLLVDDIVTTGATARESVRVLTAAGARVTAVLTIAHA